MTKAWITPDGNYYVGTHVAEGSIEVPERPSGYHQWVDGEWALDVATEKGDRINSLQATYEAEREKLNKYWLAALIADGAGETDRQATIKSQMDDFDAQLEVDILAIIME